MAVIIGIIGMVMGLAGIIIAWIALTKVQTLSVMFVKAHIHGLRTEMAKNSAAVNTIINKLAVLERAKNKAESSAENKGKEPPQASTH